MVTPLKLLLSPKILSPLSPTAVFLHTPTAQRSLDVAAKTLVFTSPNKQINKTSVTIHINDQKQVGNKQILEVNTPNKIDILEKGLYDFNWDILGKGTFGTVVKSVYKGKTVAVKVIKLQLNKGVLNESMAVGLDHQNITKTYEIIERENKNYAIVVMEYLVNFTHLLNIINQNERDIDDVLINKYSKDIVSAIQHCHKNKIVHLDVKPANVLVNLNSNLCKLCDFGNSYNLEEEMSGGDYEFHGTIVYAAPELLFGGKPTTKCDIYSFGVLLWQLIHRENPYDDIKQYEVIVYQVVKFDRRPKSSMGNQFFNSLYKECWSKDPATRPSAPDILSHLQNHSN